jgi:LmbE family N-acetylglucosaminyl deacetylase
LSSLFRWDEPRKWLFCFTHPDDELAIAASMKRLIQAGHEIHCSWTHSTPVRSLEARRAMELLQLAEERLHFFNGTDGNVCDEIRMLAPQFVQLVDEVQPDSVVTGAFEQGHLDHDATSYMLHHAYDGEILEFPLYHWYRWRSVQVVNRFSDARQQEIISLNREEIKFKILMAKRYPSQTIYNALLVNHVKDVLTLTKPKTVERELIRPSIRPDFKVPNHPANLARKIEKHPRWKRWISVMDQLQ